MSDNLQKLVGLVAMTVLVVLGVVLTNDDDTDFSRNRSFRETAGTFAGADRVEERDCCDQTLVALKQIQDQLMEHGSQLGGIEMLLGDHGSQLGGIEMLLGEHGSQLGGIETLLGEHGSQLEALQEDFQWSTSPPSPSVQQIAHQMADACPLLDPATWDLLTQVLVASDCVREYLVGFPLELARQVVLTNDTFGFFERFNFDLGDPNTTSYSYNSQHEVTTEEACGPIFYGYGPPPRVAIAVDTYQGVVLPKLNQFHNFPHATYFADKAQATASLSFTGTIGEGLLNTLHWPTYIEKWDLCQ